MPTITSNSSDTPSSSQNANSKLRSNTTVGLTSQWSASIPSAAFITIPDAVDHSNNSVDLVWVEVGRSKLLLSDKDVLLASYRQTHKFCASVHLALFQLSTAQTTTNQTDRRYTDNLLSGISLHG